jgi:SAM-dependent methyltransferase
LFRSAKKELDEGSERYPINASRWTELNGQIGLNYQMDLNNQVEYWNKVARGKVFSFPINLPLLKANLSLSSKILDYGCGYGRICQILTDEGFSQVTGIDSSSEMIRRGRELYPRLSLEELPRSGLAYPEHSFDAVLLIAVLTCIPTNTGQQGLLDHLKRILRPGGLLYLCDYVLQEDGRNQERYERDEKEFGTYGVFRLPEGTVVRHHSAEWIQTLTAGFETLDLAYPEVVTMNGNRARAFQYLGRAG